MNRSEFMRKRWSDPAFKEKMRRARWKGHVVGEFPQKHPTQKCACGCGEFVPLYNQTNRNRGMFMGQPAKFVHGHNQNGPLNHNWTGGRRVDVSGYVRIRIALNEWEYEHRLVVQEHLGRALRKEEVVHHIDGDKQNNDPSNLRVLDSHGAHTRLERTGRPLSSEHRAKIAAGMTRVWAQRRAVTS